MSLSLRRRSVIAFFGVATCFVVVLAILNALVTPPFTDHTTVTDPNTSPNNSTAILFYADLGLEKKVDIVVLTDEGQIYSRSIRHDNISDPILFLTYVVPRKKHKIRIIVNGAQPWVIHVDTTNGDKSVKITKYLDGRWRVREVAPDKYFL